MGLRDEVIAGSTAGLVGTILGFPLDSIKTRMQTSGERNFIHALDKVYQNEGIRGLYRGVASPLVALTILNTLNFTTYTEFKGLVGLRNQDIKFGTFDIRIPIAASLVGPISACISTPFELLKTKMQLQKSLPIKAQYKTTLHAAIDILWNQGARSLYIGHGVNTSREIVFLSTYFTVYEHSKSTVAAVFPKFIAVPLAGGISGAIGWLVSFPLDCVKAHIQANTDPKANLRFFSVLIQILKKHGIFGLYSGVVPSVLRALIVSSSRFSAYETTLWALGRAERKL
jgi:solute carrier family 25 carnitine/acylcarnitine transporter 20/29